MSWFLALVTIGIGIYLFFRGRGMMKDPVNAPPTLWTRCAIVIHRGFYGPAAGEKRREELLNPEKIQHEGENARDMGALFVFIGILQLGVWFSKLIELW
jgi:hypothetical protein